MNAIEIKGLCKSYPDFTLSDINLTLPQGAIMGLVGENGAGKSTTLRLIMNAASRDAGSVSVLGVDNQSASFGALKQDIGVVLDEAYFPEVLTPSDVGRVMAGTYRNWDRERYESCLDHFSLPEKKAFKDFSRGMKMKLAIAVAISHSPRLLILDEATSGLDPMMRDEILDIFNDFTRDETHSIILSSHIVSDLEKICDYIAFIQRGKLILCEEKDRLIEEYGVVHIGRGSYQTLPPESVIGTRETPYGVEALVRREGVSSVFGAERTTLEDIILFMAKGESLQ